MKVEIIKKVVIELEGNDIAAFKKVIAKVVSDHQKIGFSPNVDLADEIKLIEEIHNAIK